MTGFGRSVVENDNFIQQWEIKSVNSRFLDLKWRIPVILRPFEAAFEKIAKKYMGRGHVDISLDLKFSSTNMPSPAFNSSLADAMLSNLEKFAGKRGHKPAINYGILLGMEQFWGEPEFVADENFFCQLSDGLLLVLKDWNDSRSIEGASLGVDLLIRIERLEDWLRQIKARTPEVRKERIKALTERLNEFLAAAGCGSLDEGRLLQEIVILSDKIDVTEELVRLNAHLERLRELLAQGADTGRKLDFTLQECFREINTCGNKLTDPQVSRIVVDFKNELEKCREQVMNLE